MKIIFFSSNSWAQCSYLWDIKSFKTLQDNRSYLNFLKRQKMFCGKNLNQTESKEWNEHAHYDNLGLCIIQQLK